LPIDFHRIRTTRGTNLAVWPPEYKANYVPESRESYWLPELECADPAVRDEIILLKLRNQIQYAWENSGFYRTLWKDHGVSPASLKTLDDLASFPVIHKSDIRKAQERHPPFGDLLCIQPAEVKRIHGTSGTTGRPVPFGVGAADWDRIANAHARIMWAAGLRPEDRIIICSYFSLYVGSWGALVGGERLGATMFPFGAGVPGQTARAVEWVHMVKPTAFYSTPSYAMHFAETATRLGIEPRSLGLRILFFSGEPGAGIPATKKLIEETFGGSCIDMGSMAEVMPWMTNGECQYRTGMHLWQDLVYTQVCDPQSFKPVPFGKEGTLVYTHLERTSQPMIRLVSNDQTYWIDGTCQCGRTYPRLPLGIYGRYDDMLIVRGKNIYPSAIENALREIDGFCGEFNVIMSGRDSMDELLIQAEFRTLDGDQERLRIQELLREKLGLRPVLHLVRPGTLPRTEFKARRAIDNSNLYQELLTKQR
jgi:phenylacetate-CoA ligase